MSAVTSMRLPDDLKKKLQIRAKHDHRTLANEIESSLRLALVMQDNPDLPLQFIRDIVDARAEREMGLDRPFSL